jgi:hypothetical protein
MNKWKKKGERMKHYTLTLYNKDQNLNLTQKRPDIEQVFRHIHDGGEAKHSFKDLHRYRISQILKDHIEVDVEESGTSWHRWVGRILANDYGMREFCHGEDKRHMFRWN